MPCTDIEYIGRYISSAVSGIARSSVFRSRFLGRPPAGLVEEFMDWKVAHSEKLEITDSLFDRHRFVYLPPSLSLTLPPFRDISLFLVLPCSVPVQDMNCMHAGRMPGCGCGCGCGWVSAEEVWVWGCA
eukprot:2810875-Rhodomonas_salina.3